MERDGGVQNFLHQKYSSFHPHSSHSTTIPSFMSHPSHSKHEVNPPTTLCRGWWVDWIDASIWDLIPESFTSFLNHSHHSWIIPLILSVKSFHPPPSAEGGGWIELTLSFGMSSLNHSHHWWIIPLISSFLNHPSHSKREVTLLSVPSVPVLSVSVL